MTNLLSEEQFKLFVSSIKNWLPSSATKPLIKEDYERLLQIMDEKAIGVYDYSKEKPNRTVINLNDIYDEFKKLIDSLKEEDQFKRFTDRFDYDFNSKKIEASFYDYKTSPTTYAFTIKTKYPDEILKLVKEELVKFRLKVVDNIDMVVDSPTNENPEESNGEN